MASLRKLEGRGVDNVENVPEGTDRRVSNSHGALKPLNNNNTVTILYNR